MSQLLHKLENRQKRKTRTAKNLRTDKIIYKIKIFRSNKYSYAQLIESKTGKTIAATSDKKIKEGTKTERAKKAGIELAKKANELKIVSAVFDRSYYTYHGRVKAIAEGLREGGIKI